MNTPDKNTAQFMMDFFRSLGQLRQPELNTDSFVELDEVQEVEPAMGYNRASRRKAQHDARVRSKSR
jgi:hypothetical protein